MALTSDEKKLKFPYKEVLLGSFLEFIVHKHRVGVDVKIKPLAVNAKSQWAEIDHWGDVLWDKKKFSNIVLLK